MSHFVGTCGIVAVVWLMVGTLDPHDSAAPNHNTSAPENAPINDSGHVRLLAVGDINLGRQVGKRILEGDTLYPFVLAVDTFKQYDMVFANLECTLSDQKGETQHPRNNLIFTGPPEGGYSLARAGITIVSTANNHALDYGVGAHHETLRALDEAGILHSGTAIEEGAIFRPAVFMKNDISFAVFACTDIMNIEDSMWTRYVAPADSAKLFPLIRTYRDSVDFIIVSYHGGREYRNLPTSRTKNFARDAIDAGADLFLGHHPHVPQGIEERNGRFIVYSLGNFVFRQTEYWAQRSFAFAIDIEKSSGGTKALHATCLPVLCGLQPTFHVDERESTAILERVQSLSLERIAQHGR